MKLRMERVIVMKRDRVLHMCLRDVLSGLLPIQRRNPAFKLEPKQNPSHSVTGWHGEYIDLWHHPNSEMSAQVSQQLQITIVCYRRKSSDIFYLESRLIWKNKYWHANIIRLCHSGTFGSPSTDEGLLNQMTLSEKLQKVRTSILKRIVRQSPWYNGRCDLQFLQSQTGTNRAQSWPAQSTIQVC